MKAIYLLVLPSVILFQQQLLGSMVGGTVIGWGDNTSGEATGVPTQNPPTMSNNATGAVFLNGHVLSGVIAVAPGLALRSDGKVVQWGGYPGKNNGFVRIRGQELSDVAAIQAGFNFSIALKRDGTVVAWGDNKFGQTAVPPGLSNVTAIAAGAYQGLALKKDGTLVSWGQDNPPPKGLSNVVAVAAGGESGRNLALKRDGTVVDWPARSADYTSTVPAGLSNVMAIAAGTGHSLALKRDGTIVGWGSNQYGESTGIPNPVFPNQSSGTVTVGGQILSHVVKIAAGNEYSMAVKRDGTVVVWGHPFAMHLGVPAGLSNVVAIAAGNNFCLAITTNSAVAERFRH